MDPSKLTHLQQIDIPNPCPENWDAMDGDDRQRFCAGCGCFVHNISEIPAAEAEAMLAGPDKVCTRLQLDAKKGVLTRDGWIPRLLLAGAVAASLSGFKDADPPTQNQTEKQAPVEQRHTVGRPKRPAPEPQVKLGEATAPQEPALLGKPVAPVKPAPQVSKPPVKSGKSVKSSKPNKPTKSGKGSKSGKKK